MDRKGGVQGRWPKAARGHVWACMTPAPTCIIMGRRSGLTGGHCEGAWIDHCDIVRQVTGKTWAELETSGEASSAGPS